MRHVALSLVLFLLAGCANLPLIAPPTPVVTPSPAPTLMVYADASLSEVLRDIRTAYLQVEPNARLELDFADTPDLRARLETDPRANVVISADGNTLAFLKEQGRIKGAPHIVARNPLEVFVSRANPREVERIEDLNRQDLRFIVAAEITPLGQATRALVENFRHDAAFGPDFYDLFYKNLVPGAVNGSGVLERVLDDRADVGIVYSTEAQRASDRITVLPLQAGLDVSAEFAVATLDSSITPPTIESFVSYLASPQAQTLWRDYGFEVP